MLECTGRSSLWADDKEVVMVMLGEEGEISFTPVNAADWKKMEAADRKDIEVDGQLSHSQSRKLAANADFEIVRVTEYKARRPGGELNVDLGFGVKVHRSFKIGEMVLRFEGGDRISSDTKEQILAEGRGQYVMKAGRNYFDFRKAREEGAFGPAVNSPAGVHRLPSGEEVLANCTLVFDSITGNLGLRSIKFIAVGEHLWYYYGSGHRLHIQEKEKIRVLGHGKLDSKQERKLKEILNVTVGRSLKLAVEKSCASQALHDMLAKAETSLETLEILKASALFVLTWDGSSITKSEVGQGYCGYYADLVASTGAHSRPVERIAHTQQHIQHELPRARLLVQEGMGVGEDIKAVVLKRLSALEAAVMDDSRNLPREAWFHTDLLEFWNPEARKLVWAPVTSQGPALLVWDKFGKVRTEHTYMGIAGLNHPDCYHVFNSADHWVAKNPPQDSIEALLRKLADAIFAINVR